MEQKKNIFTNPLVITLCALLCCALWGSATPFIKIGYELVLPERDVASTILFAGIRFFLAGVFTVIIFSIARRRFIYPKKENLTVTCPKDSNISNYCKKYEINTSDKTTN